MKKVVPTNKETTPLETKDQMQQDTPLPEINENVNGKNEHEHEKQEEIMTNNTPLDVEIINVENKEDKEDVQEKIEAQKEETLPPEVEKNEEESFGSGEKDRNDKNEDESTKIGGESSVSSGDSLKDLLDVQLQFQPLVFAQLLQIHMQQGQVDLDNISPLHKLHLGDVFHASERNNILQTHQKSNELVDEAVKVLQGLPKISINNSLSNAQQLNLLLDSFYYIGLKENIEN